MVMKQERLKCKQLEVQISQMKVNLLRKILVETLAKYLIMWIIAKSLPL